MPAVTQAPSVFLLSSPSPMNFVFMFNLTQYQLQHCPFIPGRKEKGSRRAKCTFLKNLLQMSYQEIPAFLSLVTPVSHRASRNAGKCSLLAEHRATLENKWTQVIKKGNWILNSQMAISSPMFTKIWFQDLISFLI